MKVLGDSGVTHFGTVSFYESSIEENPLSHAIYFLKTGDSSPYAINTGAITAAGNISATGTGTLGYLQVGSGVTSGGGYMAVGYNAQANGYKSIAIGQTTTASGDFSLATGTGTTASASLSTAMGGSTTASGQGSVAMGESTIASGRNSFAVGQTTTASGQAQTAIGKYNIADGSNTYAFIIGNGTSTRSNALTVDWLGDLSASGKGSFAGFQLGSSATPGYVLTADASGNGTWQAAAGGVPYSGATSDLNLGSHNLTSTGTLTGNTFSILGGSAAGSGSATVLIVAGGGGGGTGIGGGGGAGGLKYYGAEAPKTPNGSALTLAVGDYAVTVGAGGAGGPAQTGANSGVSQGSNGSSSSFGAYTSDGGGGGGSDYWAGLAQGLSGGSGGGSGGYFNGTVGAGTSGEGNNGGISSQTVTDYPAGWRRRSWFNWNNGKC